MARPAETYRAGRREAFKRNGGIWFEYLLDGGKSRRPFDPGMIIKRPYMTRGWDYSKGDREKFNSVRDQYLGAKKQYRRLMRGLPV